MAIVNRTPDSFFDAGRTFGRDAALRRIDDVVAGGADIVDIGGVKAGPGDYVDAQEECRRTVDLVEAVRERHPGVVVSVDTWRHEVAQAVCEAGADLLNDAWGGFDPKLAEVAAEFGTGLVCSHAGGAAPRSVPGRIQYRGDVLEVVTGALTDLADRAERLGVHPDGIVLDPAHDFGKTTRHSLEVTRRIGEIVALGRPVMVAVSNKDFIGETLDAPVEDRLGGTLAVTTWCLARGARIVRAHDVPRTRQVIDMVATLLGYREPARLLRGMG